MQAYADSEYDSGAYRDYVLARSVKIAHFEHRLREMLPHISPGRLLDVGCACGYFMEVAAGKGFDVTGLEFSRGAIAAAAPTIRQRIQHRTLADIDESQMNGFDVITAFDIVEHIIDAPSFLQKIARMLKPQGALAISTPNARHFLRYIMGRRWPMLQPMQHVSLFSRTALRIALRKAGFEVVKMDAAYKTVTMSYLINQLRELNPSLFPVLKGLVRLVPRAVAERPRRVNIGELFVIAKRR